MTTGTSFGHRLAARREIILAAMRHAYADNAIRNRFLSGNLGHIGDWGFESAADLPLTFDSDRARKRDDGRKSGGRGWRTRASMEREERSQTSSATPKMSFAEAATYSYLTDSFSPEKEISLYVALLFPRVRARA